MTEVFHSVQVEPHLHVVSGEVVFADNARVDIRASFHFDKLIAHSNRTCLFTELLYCHRKEQFRVIPWQCQCEVEHGSFIPLVFSSSGGMGKVATTTYKHLAHLLSEKWSSPYSVVIG